MQVIPTAWDYVFRSLEGKTWTLVTLQDGRVVAGLFGPGSFASDTAGERDLFLEAVYTVGEDGLWSLSPYSRGILLKGEEIAHIEFFRV